MTNLRKRIVAPVAVGVYARKISGRRTGNPAIQYRPVGDGGAARRLAMVRLAILLPGKTIRSLLWAEWNEQGKKRLASRDRRHYKASVCASRG